jgi:hypothetical protein
MQSVPLKYDLEGLLSTVFDERIDAVEEQARLLQAFTGPLDGRILELQTLASLASALSGFLNDLGSELSLAVWLPIEERTLGVVSLALTASRQVIAKARAGGAKPSTLTKVLAAAESIRVLRENVILAALRAG